MLYWQKIQLNNELKKNIEKACDEFQNASYDEELKPNYFEIDKGLIVRINFRLISKPGLKTNFSSSTDTLWVSAEDVFNQTKLYFEIKSILAWKFKPF